MQLLILLKCACTRQHTAHADDVSLLGRSVKAIREVVTQLKEAALNIGISDKTRAKENTQKYNRFREDLIIDGQVFEGVQNFRYLGTLINSKKYNK